jgi:hypothetical protein
MNDAITEEEAVVGTLVDFYQRPADKQPLIKTTIAGIEYYRKLFIMGEGLNEWFPFYHFKKSTSTIRYGSEITYPLDDLQARLGI